MAGKWNKIPFMGTVGNDTVISLEEGPRITITVDLPIFFNDTLNSVIVCKHKDIRRLNELSEKSAPKKISKTTR